MRPLYLALLWLAVHGCAPSQEEIAEDYDAFVSQHQACARDSDCTLIQPGCPLGCSTPIRTDAAAAGERLARELIADYESGGRSCDYECLAVCGAACDSGRCVAVFPPQNTTACPR